MDEDRWPGESRYHKKQVLRNFMISTTLFIKVGIYVQLQSKQDASPTTYRTLRPVLYHTVIQIQAISCQCIKLFFFFFYQSQCIKLLTH